jgi:hypothetical protein
MLLDARKHRAPRDFGRGHADEAAQSRRENLVVRVLGKRRTLRFSLIEDPAEHRITRGHGNTRLVCQFRPAQGFQIIDKTLAGRIERDMGADQRVERLIQ